MKQSIHRFDQHVTNWVVATFGQGSRTFFELMTMLGDPIAISIVTIGIIGAGIYSSSMRLAISGAMIPVTVLVGALLKLGFERARPLTEYAMSMRIQTFSFPSGHSSGSMIAYGLLAYLAFVKLPAPWNIIVGLVLAGVPFFVGVSRIYLGAHFPSDVVAGWALGLIMLAVVIFVIRPLIA
jgi:membrane-associated phospholipid phosphatase